MSRRLSEAEQASYARIVSAILPAAHGMPDGNAVGVSAGGLDAVLRLRPEIAGEFLRAIRGYGAEGDLDALQADAEAWHAIRLCAYGAYYSAPEVQAILRYSGRTAQPFDADETPAYLTDGSLRQVIDRGPIWRPAPD